MIECCRCPRLCCVPLQIADVLQLVVQHCPDASDIKTLCSLLSSSSAVQQAVQQALGHCRLTMPDVVWQRNIWSTSRLSACCTWLPKHAGLITHLSFGENAVCDTADQPVLDTAQHVLSLALQLCAVQAQTAAVVAAASSHLASSSSRRRTRSYSAPTLPPALAATAAAVPWQLRSVRIEWLVSPAILHALSACTSLTNLDLNLRAEASTDTALFAAMGHMEHLQELKLYIASSDAALEAAFAAGIRHLTRLRKLELLNYLKPTAAEALPASLQTLTAVIGGDDDDPAVISMSQLVALQDLQLTVHGVLGEASALPPNVTQLSCEGALHGVQGLQELRVLYLQDGRECLPFLQQLSALGSLQEVDVGVDFCDMREELGLPGQPTELERILSGIAGAQQLTKLLLVDRSASQCGEPIPSPMFLHGAKLHPHLQQLTNLRHLDIASLDVQPEDAVHFTALKSLTALHLYNCWKLGDVAAAGIACHLSNLRVLELIDCGLESPVVWPAVGMCTSLESLCIDSAPNTPLRLDESTLHLLTNLTRLTSLTGPEVRMTAQAFDSFCAASLPALVRKPLI